MFSMGFEPQVRSIAKSIRPDRHTVLFSATSNNRLQKLSKDIMSGRVVKIVQGDIGHINDNIQQHLFFVNGVKQKLNWLLSTLVGLSSTGQFTLVFVNQKAHAESVNSHLRNNSLSSDVIHGDLGQHSRNAVIKEFRDKKISIMVATDVASRGLDIPHITTIINFDLPAKFETFVHRLGRTARAGNTGIGYTLVNSKDNPDIVAQIVKSIQNNPTETRIEIPQEILAIASKSKHSDNKNSKSKTKSVGLGYVYKECAINPSEVVCGKASVQQSSHAKSLKNSLQNSFKSNFVAADKNIQMETLNAGKNKSRWDN
ncbi:MAG: ATP-dependent RNA helicase ddx42 [Marteilia pararefringens]